MITYKRHRFSPAIISYAVWLDHIFSLSHRDIEDLLAERGIAVSYEAICKSAVRIDPPKHQEPITYMTNRRRIWVKFVHRSTESLKNLTPADVYFGRGQSILASKERIKKRTIAKRRLHYQRHAA